MLSASEPTLHGFAPLVDPRATRLVLGSMPGTASLAAGEYYAHARNAFWAIAESLFGTSRTAPYSRRTLALLDARVAVWDVLASCHRQGSLDSAIEPESIQSNDFRAFFDRHPGIQRIFFNGGAAMRLYVKHVLPQLPEHQQELERIALPSTSPANARLTLAEKTKAWRALRSAR